MLGGTKMKTLFATTAIALAVFGVAQGQYVDARPTAFQPVNSITHDPLSTLFSIDGFLMTLHCAVDDPDAMFGADVQAFAPFRPGRIELTVFLGPDRPIVAPQVQFFNFVRRDWDGAEPLQFPASGVRDPRLFVYGQANGAFVNPASGEAVARIVWPASLLRPFALDLVSFRFYR